MPPPLRLETNFPLPFTPPRQGLRPNEGGQAPRSTAHNVRTFGCQETFDRDCDTGGVLGPEEKTGFAISFNLCRNCVSRPRGWSLERGVLFSLFIPLPKSGGLGRGAAWRTKRGKGDTKQKTSKRKVRTLSAKSLLDVRLQRESGPRDLLS